METVIENIVSEIDRQYDDICKEAFKECGYDLDYVYKNPTAFHRCYEDFATGHRDIFFLGDPTKGNAVALFEIERETDFDKNEIYVRYNIFNRKGAQSA